MKAGDKPWISEMYGYAFGAATADVWHRWDDTSMMYPGLGFRPQGEEEEMCVGVQAAR